MLDLRIEPFLQSMHGTDVKVKLCDCHGYGAEISGRLHYQPSSEPRTQNSVSNFHERVTGADGGWSHVQFTLEQVKSVSVCHDSKQPVIHLKCTDNENPD